jgi:hypothetical protein
VFNNASANGTGQFTSDGSGGAWGLTSLYTSVCNWTKTSFPDRGIVCNDRLVQVAESAITSYGIFDYDGTLPNPAEYQPIANAYDDTYLGTFMNRIGFPFGAYAFEGNDGITDLQLFRYPSPSLTAVNKTGQGNLIAPVRFAPQENLSVYLYGGAAIVDSAFLSEKPCYINIENGIYGFSPSLFVDWAIGAANGKGGYEQVQTYQQANNLWNNVLNPVAAIQNASGGAISPKTGNCIITCHQPIGLSRYEKIIYEGAQFEPTPSPFYTMNIYYPDIFDQVAGQVIEPTHLSDPGDNAKLVTNEIANYTPTVTPYGDFLIRNSDGTFFLICGDLSGYYRVNFNGVDSASQVAVGTGGSASTGFGMDLDGNVWFGGTAAFLPMLYSTMDNTWGVTINPLPDLPTVGIGCRVMGGKPAWIWEG